MPRSGTTVCHKIFFAKNDNKLRHYLAIYRGQEIADALVHQNVILYDEHALTIRGDLGKKMIKVTFIQPAFAPTRLLAIGNDLEEIDPGGYCVHGQCVDYYYNTWEDAAQDLEEAILKLRSHRSRNP